MPRSILIAIAIASSIGVAHADTPFAPLNFLIGSCWEGPFVDGKQVDRHCFRWVFEGKIMRDRHRVRASADAPPGPSDYVGESIYSVDPKSKTLVYRYFSSEGEVIDGRVEAGAGRIVFPSEMQTPKGVLKIRAIWSPKGPDGYETVEEQYKDGKWQRMFSQTMKRVGPAPAEPEFP